jgi:DNA-binding MarR family transcriptional regulator
MADQLATDLRLALGRIARRMRRFYVDADEGPSFLELAVMHRLMRGDAFPNELAGDEGVTSAAVASSLKSLEARGLVSRERDDADRRRVSVTLTAAGKHTLRRRDDASVARLAEVLAHLTVAERQHLAAAVPLLERIASEM